MPQPTAIVTGGSGAIGKACARTLVQRGYDVVMAARRADRLEVAAAEVGGRPVVADCTREPDVRRVLEAAGRPAIIVHAAGTVAGGGIREQGPDRFDEILGANLRAAYLVTRAALPVMPAGGRLVLLSSTAGLKGVRGFSAYSASKAGMNAFAQAVAAEVEPDGIGVHLIVPGPVRSEMLDRATHGDLWLLEPEDVASALGWIESLPPRVVVREIVMRSVMSGPFAPDPVPAEEH